MGIQNRTRDIIDTAVENLTDFRRGNVWAEHVEKGHSQTKWGWLDREWVNKLNTDILNNEVFILFSFQTPMAWFNGESWTFPDESYSKTTTQHQNAYRVAIHRYSDKPVVNG